ncbi:hypothetical protein [Nonomuraea sp. NPDC005650]|uniref:hypothetical protein n=1 Tax=Nonomuraea sp. NPDC005650 TaxID=3157045 RepID=UPI0033B1A7DA
MTVVLSVEPRSRAKDRVGRVTDFMHSLDVIAGGGIVIDPKVVGHIGNIFAKLGLQPEDGNRRVLAVLTHLQAAGPDPRS